MMFALKAYLSFHGLVANQDKKKTRNEAAFLSAVSYALRLAAIADYQGAREQSKAVSSTMHAPLCGGRPIAGQW